VTWQDDLLAALGAMVAETDSDSLTTTEMAARMGWNRKTMDERIATMWRAGTLECVRKRITTRAGYERMVPAYRMRK